MGPVTVYIIKGLFPTTLENVSWTSKCVFDGKPILVTTLLALYIRFILQRNFFVIEMETRLLLYVLFFNVILLSSARNFDLSSQFDGF